MLVPPASSGAVDGITLDANENQTRAPLFDAYLRFVAQAAAGGGGTAYFITPAGTLTPSGSIVKLTDKRLGGTVTPAGGLIKLADKRAAGTLTPAGAIAKLVAKPLGGSLSPAGALTLQRVVQLALAGSFTPTGALVKTTAKALTGSLAPAGTLRKLVARLLSGTVAPTGAETNYLSSGAPTDLATNLHMVRALTLLALLPNPDLQSLVDTNVQISATDASHENFTQALSRLGLGEPDWRLIPPAFAITATDTETLVASEAFAQVLSLLGYYPQVP